MMTPERPLQCCIAGGGPAGLMLGLLLARAGVEVAVFEKHADFLRDFRGDTIHPSTLELLYELGLLEDFLRLPHQKVTRLSAFFGAERFALADFSHLPVHRRYLVLLPQWDFLNFLAERASLHANFHLHREAKAIGLLNRGDRIAGLTVETAGGRREFPCDLVVAADGRHSTLRDQAGLRSDSFGAPMDVLWFRLPRLAGDPEQTGGYFAAGRLIVLLNRGDYWQCAFVIAKGTMADIHARGITAFRAQLAAAVPFLADRAESIAAWDEVKLLSVSVDRLRRWWRPGLLFIGDAAHAMSPIGGVGINLAIQDAVAAANLLAPGLAADADVSPLLAKVQERRDWPVRATQRLQLFLQNRLIRPLLAGRIEAARPPFFLRLLRAFPPLQRLTARLIGLGFRPEHIGRR